MKKVILIVMGFTLWSCANEVRSPKYQTTEKEEWATNEPEDFAVEEASDSEDVLKAEAINFEAYSTQKLQEYFDLVKLKQEHPEFKDDIILQLQKFTNDSTIGQTYGKNFKISNIKQIGSSEKISDSVIKLKLYFDIIQNNILQTDSIMASIYQNKTVIDGEDIITNKITFSKVWN